MIFLIVVLNSKYFESKELTISIQLKGYIYSQNYALLYEHVMVNSNEAQLFGSQVELDEASNKFKPKKTVSAELVNAYRLYFGLDTIESYLDIMNKEYNND